eukprot:1142609-Pelagomonas_calceolata.AAC.10
MKLKHLVLGQVKCNSIFYLWFDGEATFLKVASRVFGAHGSLSKCTPGSYRGGCLLVARRWRAGEGGFRHPGAWPATLQIPISSVAGFLLG